MLQTRVGGPRWHFEQFVAVQIDKTDLLAAELICEPALGEHQICVSLVPRTLSDHDTGGTQLEKRLRGGSYHHGMRIDLDAWDVFHQIRFKQHGFSAQVELKLP